MKRAIKFFQTLAIALAISFTLLSIPGMTSPAAAVDCSSHQIQPRTSGIVTRVNVPNFGAGKKFYGDTLGMTCISNFSSSKYYAEFYLNNQNASIGLSNQFGDLKMRTVPTLIVEDIAKACTDLKENETPIIQNDNPGSGVCLAFFVDAGGKELAYRQEKWISSVNTDEQCQTILESECKADLE